MSTESNIQLAGPIRDPADTILADTAIVIALKDDRRIFECIASVDEQVEIVLALNGTPPELRSELLEHRSRPQLTDDLEAGNLGAAYNAGIAKTGKRFILMMDSDCRFVPGAIRAMAQRAVNYPVVKGQVLYAVASRPISRLIARIREFDEGDYISALSPPLLYDRRIEAYIGGHQYDPLIHWCEDREFDFRLQMANIPVMSERRGQILHDAQVGAQDLRSYFRYGLGEGIGQELGLFTTPAIPLFWRLVDDLRIVAECARAKGLFAGVYYAVTLLAFHAGTICHLLFDPYRVRPKYPAWARRVRLLRSIPQHCVQLTDAQKQALREHHQRAGRSIQPSDAFTELMEKAQKEAGSVSAPPRNARTAVAT